MHICFTSPLRGLHSIQDLVQANGSFVLATSVTSVKLTIEPEAFISPHMNIQYFQQLGAWLPHLQRVHIHLSGAQAEKETLIRAAWLPAHCRLVVTHNLKGLVRVVRCPPGFCRFPCPHILKLNGLTPCDEGRTPPTVACTFAPAA